MMIPRRSGMSFAHVFEASLLQTLSALVSVAQASHSLTQVRSLPSQTSSPLSYSAVSLA